MASCGSSSGSAGGTGGSGGASAGGGGSSTGGNRGTGGGLGGGPGSGGSSGGSIGSTGGANAGSSGSGGNGGGAAPAACPANATFCSGFEQTGIPAGAIYKANAAPGDWTRDFALDTTVHHTGAASLRVKATTEGGTSGAYRMLAVPTPGPAFWVRLYLLQMDADVGSVDHNVFAGASGSDEPNDPVMVELAEDVGVAFNSHDVVRWPAGFGRTTAGGMNPFTLAKDVWHCVEISYDGVTREQKLFVDGAPEIDATDFPAASTPPMSPFLDFKFGFNELHGPTRKIWYDDVVVAPQRIPCL